MHEYQQFVHKFHISCTSLHSSCFAYCFRYGFLGNLINIKLNTMKRIFSLIFISIFLIAYSQKYENHKCVKGVWSEKLKRCIVSKNLKTNYGWDKSWNNTNEECKKCDSLKKSDRSANGTQCDKGYYWDGENCVENSVTKCDNDYHWDGNNCVKNSKIITLDKSEKKGVWCADGTWAATEEACNLKKELHTCPDGINVYQYSINECPQQNTYKINNLNTVELYNKSGVPLKKEYKDLGKINDYTFEIMSVTNLLDKSSENYLRVYGFFYKQTGTNKDEGIGKEFFLNQNEVNDFLFTTKSIIDFLPVKSTNNYTNISYITKDGFGIVGYKHNEGSGAWLQWDEWEETKLETKDLNDLVLILEKYKSGL